MNPMLSNLLAATLAGNFVFCEPADVADLLTNGLAEQNPTLMEGTALATRLTDAGIKYVNELSASTSQTTAPTETTSAAPVANSPAPTTTTAAQSFARASFTLPAEGSRKRREGADKYPFDVLKAPSEMPAGQVDAFFVAKSADVPDPAKTLRSACSAATRRYATVRGTKVRNGKTVNDYNYVRKFEVFDGADQNGNPGVWVGRTL